MTIGELRRVAQDIQEPPTFRLPRLISIYLTRLLLRTSLTANAVTFAQWFCLLGAALSFGVGTPLANAAGSLLIFLSYVLDCVDGELARARGAASKIGSQLEQMVHWTGGGLLILGATYGTTAPDSAWRWIVGFAALLGETTFHFMYNQLNMYARTDVSYGCLHPVTRALYSIMPINTNLMILGGVTNQVFGAVLVWAIIANTAVVTVFGAYYCVEVRLARIGLGHAARAGGSESERSVAEPAVYGKAGR